MAIRSSPPSPCRHTPAAGVQAGGGVHTVTSGDLPPRPPPALQLVGYRRMFSDGSATGRTQVGGHEPMFFLTKILRGQLERFWALNLPEKVTTVYSLCIVAGLIKTSSGIEAKLNKLEEGDRLRQQKKQEHAAA